MSDTKSPRPGNKSYHSRAEIESAPEVRVKHPLNPNSEVFLKPLGHATGLQRMRISIARIPPGKESFIYHAHERDEEFLYILSGRGRAEIADDVIEVEPGDFMAFTAPSVAHHLTNPYDEDLVYLMGGEHSGFDVGVFPRLGKRIVFANDKITLLDDEKVASLTLADFLPDGIPKG